MPSAAVLWTQGCGDGNGSRTPCGERIEQANLPWIEGMHQLSSDDTKPCWPVAQVTAVVESLAHKDERQRGRLDLCASTIQHRN
jgi:hypothetical protein